MNFVVPYIVEVLMNKITLWINIRAKDWTTERAIIASNEAFLLKLNFIQRKFSFVGLIAMTAKEKSFQFGNRKFEIKMFLERMGFHLLSRFVSWLLVYSYVQEKMLKI